MNIALLWVLIIITGETDGFHVEKTKTSFKKDTEERIFLRKLQTFKRHDPNEVKTATWNQILADALVNRIKIFSFRKVTDNEGAANANVNNNFLTNFISQMMNIYKTLIYDKINKHPDTEVIKDEEYHRERKYNAGKDANIETEKDFPDPKDEVELIEPRYHGKMCDDCKGNEKNSTTENETTEIVETSEIVQTTATVCPAGLVAGESGGCTDPKSKFILSIPYQCPTGYRRDWLGYCRRQLS